MIINGVDVDVDELIKKHGANKVEAARELRSLTGISLKESMKVINGKGYDQNSNARKVASSKIYLGILAICVGSCLIGLFGNFLRVNVFKPNETVTEKTLEENDIDIDTDEEEQLEVPKKTVSVKPKPVTEKKEPISPEDSLKERIVQITKDEFGEENYIMVNYVPEDNFVLIKAKNETSAKAILLHVFNTLKALKNIPDLDVDINVVSPVINTDGTSDEVIVLKASFSYETRSSIVWDRVLWENIGLLADDWWEDPAFTAQLNK